MKKKRDARSSWAARGLVLLAILGLDAATSACGKIGGHPLERTAEAGPAEPAAPKVTVATPIVESIHEWTEYTGRSQAVDSVEIRPRVGGYLQRAAFKEGDRVKKGDLLFVIDPRPFAASQARAQAELEGARAEVALAHLDADRSAKLYAEHVIAKSANDLDQSQLVQREAATRRAEASLREVSLDLDYSQLRAPIDGRIGRLQITPGNLVGPTTVEPLTTLVSIDPLYVYVDVRESESIALGQAEHAALAGFAGEDGYPHQAKIDFVDNHIDASTGTVKVRAVVANADGKLTPGLFARVKLGASEASQALLVDDAALGTDQSHRFAYVVDKDGVVQRRELELGGLHEGLRIVRKGLAGDDQVVTHGLQRIRPGAKVEIESAPMRPAPTTAQATP